MKKGKKELVDTIFEDVYPIGFAILITVGYLGLNIELKDSFEDLLSASIGFASIMLGFLGVLIALLFSLNGRMKNYIFENEHYKARIKRYFKVPIETGFTFVIISLLMYLRKTLLGFSIFSALMMNIVKVIWIFIFVWFTAASYRLIHIVLHIAFKDTPQEPNSEDEEDKLDEEAYRLAQEQNRGNKSNKNK